MPFDPLNSGAGSWHRLSRRDLLRTSVALGAMAALAVPLPASAAPDDTTQAFMQLSEFLTARKLDPVLGGRYFAALAKRNPNLAADIASLQQAITTSGAADMDAFLAQAATDPALLASMQKIVGAWYLGVVGEPEDAELITYSEALMYAPTKGILTIPSYGPGPNAWGPKPDSNI
ncbi:sugar dehydrogenase complex small subunit [Rhizobium sp. 18055]|jgi:hypothetical protein|uniref:sugar dehydrogenase complex small subunit n=1 Tax=Rhizobium sp. 18055 TaxID=2681403 RepID=UPI001357894D|nr:sugar dehydrogenase complex small subunit [Rhizobium sp. 18055]